MLASSNSAKRDNTTNQIPCKGNGALVSTYEDFTRFFFFDFLRYLCEIEDVPDAEKIKNAFRLKASEDYILGLNSKPEKENWMLHYRQLVRQSAPRKGFSFFLIYY